MSRQKPKHTRAIFVVSHNRYLVRELLPAKPHYVHIGSDPLDSLKAWTERPVSAADPEKVEAESLARFRRISAMLKEKR
jgi:hypothetical protein